MLTVKDALLNCTLRLIAQGDLDLSGTPDVKNLLDQLRAYRAKLDIIHPLKQVVLPDEVRPITPIRTGKVSSNRKLGT